MESPRCHPRSLKEKELMINTIEVLDEEKETILSDILKCSVCLEITKGKQVKICEKGHHFCMSCHTKMKYCGMCRGKLLEGRNFVVEEIVAQLGPILGVTEPSLSPLEAPAKLPKGPFHCLHGCPRKMAAFEILPHLRADHPRNLLENVRSNPCTGGFSSRFSLSFLPDSTYIWSVHVGDMGLFTVEVSVSEGWELAGRARALGEAPFRYRLAFGVRRESAEFEYGMSEGKMPGYQNEGGRGLVVKAEQLSGQVNVGEVVSVHFSVRRGSEGEWESRVDAGRVVGCELKGEEKFKNERRRRRNRSRKLRRKENLKRHSEAAVSA